MSYLNTSEIESAIIIGAGHGIGLALCRQLLVSNPKVIVYASYRQSHKAQSLFELQSHYPNRLNIYQVNPIIEEQLVEFKNSLNLKSTNLLINCIGTLQDEVVAPERSLRDIDINKLQHYFFINSSITPVIAKVFKSYFRGKHASCFCAISAKVGSIDDNAMGGWYGYRASKAALNMFLKNISLEFKRSAPNSVVLAIHPGTTVTELSKDFIQNTNLLLHTTDETAQNILNIIKNKDPKNTGDFVSWDQNIIPW